MSTVIFANDVPIIHVIAVWGVRSVQITAVIVFFHALTCSALTVFCSPLLTALVGLERWDYRKRKVLAAQLYPSSPGSCDCSSPPLGSLWWWGPSRPRTNRSLCCRCLCAPLQQPQGPLAPFPVGAVSGCGGCPGSPRVPGSPHTPQWW